jgi:acylphosphatase
MTSARKRSRERLAVGTNYSGSEIMHKKLHVYYQGNVQGVGFRFTVREIAKDLGVFGWICNLADGRVELVSEAEEGVLKEFLERIDRYFARYIDDKEVSWESSAHGFQDFRIKI